LDAECVTFVLSILPFIFVGFLAQIIDGALGMAYGVSSTSLLLGLGVPPVTASATVHTAEIFTTAASGFSHWRLGNTDSHFVRKLLVPGVIGGVLGAYILASIPGDRIKPFVALYLLIMGIVILWKVIRGCDPSMRPTPLVSLGLIGGFFDAIGGGGWGPIVTSTLVAHGNQPRHTIGSVNMVEFFVTLAESITFIASIGLSHWNVIIGLIIGGIVAAPFGAHIVRKLPTKAMLTGVGLLIVCLSLHSITQAF
jgi:uncharacterized membrane protein YfcA